MLSVWLETWWLFIACLPLSPTVKEFRKSVKIFRILSDICFGPWCIRHIFHCHESQIAPFVPYHLVSGIIFTFHVVSLNLITVPMHFIHGFHTTIFSDTRNFLSRSGSALLFSVGLNPRLPQTISTINCLCPVRLAFVDYDLDRTYLYCSSASIFILSEYVW